MERSDFSPIEDFSADAFESGLTPFIKDVFLRFGPQPKFYITVFCLQKDQQLKNVSVSSSVFVADSFQHIEYELSSAYADFSKQNNGLMDLYPRFIGLSESGEEIWRESPLFTGDLPGTFKYDLYNQAIWRRCYAGKSLDYDVIVKIEKPIITDNYVLFVVLSLNAEWVMNYTGSLNSCKELESKSFINQVIQAMGEFLANKKWTTTLGCLDGPKYSSSHKSMFHNISKIEVDRIFEVAAESYFTCHMFAESAKGFAVINEKAYGAETFHNIKMIAAHKYETKECKAELRITDKCDIGSIGLQPRFKEIVHMGRHRTIRKLLESTGPNAQLVANKDGVLGMSSKDSRKDNDLVIRFVKFMTWELYKYNEDSSRRIFIFEEGEIKSQDIGLLAQKASNIAREQLDIPVASWPDYDFKMLINEVQKLGHGGILAFTLSPELEAKRLQKSCFPVVPFKITPNNLGSLTAMDGALLIDFNLYCHAIGVILDGVEAPEQADQSRGSRFNSAIRYYNGRKKDNIKTLIVVVSDDGMIDIIPLPDD